MSPWMRACDEAETLEDDLLDYARDGVITPIELARMRRLLRRNTTRHDQARCVVSLATTYLHGGEESRHNYDSQTSKRNRMNSLAGYPTLAFVDGKGVSPEEDDAA